MSLKPAHQNFRIWKGATFRAFLTLLLNGNPWEDLTSFSGLLEIRKEPEKGEPLLTLSTDNGRIIMKPQATIELYIPASTTQELSWEEGVYDLLVTAPGPEGDTTVLLFGGFLVRGV